MSHVAGINRTIVLGPQECSLRGRITVYREDALPQNAVHTAYQDSRNFLWFGTQEGVVRFDGGEWTPFRMADGLVYNFVEAIAEDRMGRLWFGTRLGLSCFDPIHRSAGWRSYTDDDGLPDMNIRAIATDADGALWLGTRRGLACLEPSTGQCTAWGERDSPVCNDISTVLTDSTGCIWVGSNVAGLAVFDPKTKRWSAFPHAPNGVSCLARDSAGRVWLGTPTSGAFRLDPRTGNVVPVATVDGPENPPPIVSILCDSHGDVWFGSGAAGASCLRASSSTLIRLAVDDGLPDYTVLSLLEDRNGLLWIGTLGGLTCFQREGTYRDTAWQTFTHADGLAHDLVAAVMQDSSNRFWFGTFGRGVSSLEMRGGENIWRSYQVKDGLGNNTVRAIAEDRLHRIWFGTFSGGLSRFAPERREWRAITAADGLAGNAVRHIREDGNGLFWVATDGGGVSVFDPVKEPLQFTNYTTANGLTSNRTSTIVHGRDATFVGTYEGGLCIRARDGSWSAMNRSSGFPVDDVYSIAEDPAGRLWIGSGGSGLIRIEAGVTRVYNEKDGLPNDVIYQILVESERSLYCSTNRGVFRLTLDAESETVLSFDRTDGLGDDEANGGASYCDRQGRLWFGTIGGASFIDPSRVPQHVPSCSVFMTDFLVQNELLDLAGTPEIEDSKYEFVFQYGALEYMSPQKVRYRSRLRGLESEWSKVSTLRAIRYTNLRPGKYTFQVQARNWGGQWSAPAELSFEVVPDPARVAREEAIERERIDKAVLEQANVRLQQLADELRTANERLREKELLLESQAREDPLTGLMNRRYLDLHLSQEYERCVRFQRPFSVVIGDLDSFKSVNDQCGHVCGDDVLRISARLIRANVRSIDIAARYGGDEFVIVLPETTGAAAAVVSEKIRSAIADYPWPGVDARLRVTISIGFCDDTNVVSAEEMLRIADKRLFEAKRLGRNHVCGDT